MFWFKIQFTNCIKDTDLSNLFLYFADYDGEKKKPALNPNKFPLLPI